MSFFTNFVTSFVIRLRMLLRGSWAHLFKSRRRFWAAGGEGLKAKAFAALQDPRVQSDQACGCLRASLPNLVLSKQLVAAYS